jgi:membrane fusion protein (multidrug efflux system)
MTEELELEQAAPETSPKPKLVEAKPVAHNVPAHSRRRLSLWLLLLAVLGIAASGGTLWFQSRGFETTDDAQVDGHFHSLSPRISGTVVYVNPKAENNQSVEAGTLLVELDPRDYEAELDHATADLDTRKAELVVGTGDGTDCRRERLQPGACFRSRGAASARIGQRG